MESTGIYWKPVLHVLRAYSLNLIVVNARHINNVPGRKTDKADSDWHKSDDKIYSFKGSVNNFV